MKYIKKALNYLKDNPDEWALQSFMGIVGAFVGMAIAKMLGIL